MAVPLKKYHALTGAYPRGGPPHLCQRLFLRMMQIRWGKGSGHLWSVSSQFAKYGEWSEFTASFGIQTRKGFQLKGLRLLTPDQGLCSWAPAGGSAPDYRYRLALRARHVCPSHIFLPDLDTHGGSNCCSNHHEHHDQNNDDDEDNNSNDGKHDRRDPHRTSWTRWRRRLTLCNHCTQHTRHDNKLRYTYSTIQ